MSEEEQERFEDYLELERFIEQSSSPSSVSPPANLTPQLKRVYEMAQLFRAASPPVADTRPEFKAQLYQRLREQMQATDQENMPSSPLAEAAPPPPPPPERQSAQKKRGMSRRVLFTSGSLAASLVAGTGIGVAIEHALEPAQNPTDLNPHLKGTAWQFVAPVDQLGTDPIRFTADTVTGYVIRQAEDSTEPIIAFSAACTHLGCIVQWKASSRQFPCPCHGRTFDAVGYPVYNENSNPHYVSLPRLDTKVENGNIYVKVPVL